MGAFAAFERVLIKERQRDASSAGPIRGVGMRSPLRWLLRCSVVSMHASRKLRWPARLVSAARRSISL
jgi:DNA invertase Pin-like site-specific DNA recombinase